MPGSALHATPLLEPHWCEELDNTTYLRLPGRLFPSWAGLHGPFPFDNQSVEYQNRCPVAPAILYVTKNIPVSAHTPSFLVYKAKVNPNQTINPRFLNSGAYIST